VRGGDFYLNNRRHFVRGYGDDAIYPLTLVSPASRKVHGEHLRLARAFGFNYVRHHTHCELPEFFEAADEVGIMVQPELPYWGTGASAGAGWFRPREDLRELITHYRRYVSLSTYCTGNEGRLGSPVDREIYALAKKLDPTRLFLHQDGGYNIPQNSDFGTGPAREWRANTVSDGRRAWFAHEYLNLAVSRDPRLAPKYTGAQLPPLPMARHLNELKASGLDAEWGNRTLDSGHYLQRLWQKVGLETARLDTRCDGYSYWTIHNVDYASDQGLLDQFWGVKKSTPEFFRQFNGPTAVLAVHGRAPIGAAQRILGEGDTLKVDWWMSHFGEAPLKQAVLTWRVAADGRVLGRGRIENIDAAIGDVKKVGVGSWAVKDIGKPVHARLIGELEGTKVENSWDLWLFPRLRPRDGAGKGLAASGKVHDVLKSRYPGLARLGKPDAKKAQVLITDRMDGAFFDALATGKSVLLVALGGPRPGVRPGWWAIGHGGQQTGIAVADHPAFGDFPHQGYLRAAGLPGPRLPGEGREGQAPGVRAERAERQRGGRLPAGPVYPVRPLIPVQAARGVRHPAGPAALEGHTFADRGAPAANARRPDIRDQGPESRLRLGQPRDEPVRCGQGAPRGRKGLAERRGRSREIRAGILVQTELRAVCGKGRSG